MRTCRTSSHHLHPPTRVFRSAVSRLNLVYPSEQIGWVVRVLTNGHDIHVHTRSLLRIYSPVCVCWFACCVTVDLRSGLFFFVYSLPSISLRLPPSPPFLAGFHDDFFFLFTFFIIKFHCHSVAKNTRVPDASSFFHFSLLKGLMSGNCTWIFSYVSRFVN